jgi:SHS family lactate transporter-like MFS transporter
MFFLGGLPALLALFVRFHVKESEVWEKSRKENWGQLGRSIAGHWKLFLYLTALMTMMSFSSHGTQDMYPTFLQRQWGFDPRKRSVITAISMVGAIIGGTLMGLVSDRIGRKRALILSLLCAMATIPLWAWAPNVGLLIAGAFIMQFFVQGAWGIIPAHLTELSPDDIRGFLPGFAYQCGVLMSASVAYIEAVTAARFTYSIAMAITAVVVFTGAAVAMALGPEKKGIHFGAGKG